MEIQWAEPPEHAVAAARARGQYTKFAIELRKNPGRWAILPSAKERTPKGAHATMLNLQRGRMKDFQPKEHWETVNDDVTIYVRFLGEPESEPTPPGPEPEERDEEGETEPEASEPAPERPPGTTPVANAAEVRAWARNNGFNIPERGRMPQEVWDAYYKAEKRSHVRVVQ